MVGMSEKSVNFWDGNCNEVSQMSTFKFYNSLLLFKSMALFFYTMPIKTDEYYHTYHFAWWLIKNEASSCQTFSSFSNLLIYQFFHPHVIFSLTNLVWSRKLTIQLYVCSRLFGPPILMETNQNRTALNLGCTGCVLQSQNLGVQTFADVCLLQWGHVLSWWNKKQMYCGWTRRILVFSFCNVCEYINELVVVP